MGYLHPAHSALVSVWTSLHPEEKYTLRMDAENTSKSKQEEALVSTWLQLISSQFLLFILREMAITQN
jgi:hypothetical protein